MRRSTRGAARPLAAALLVGASALAVSGCVSEAAPRASSRLLDQVTDFGERVERIVWSRPSPESLWRQLDPELAIGGPTLADGFTRSTEAPYPFSHAIDGEVLTVEIFASAENRTGQSVSADGPWEYVCATFVVEPREQTVSRHGSDCPVDVLPPAGEARSLDELDDDSSA